MKEGLLNFLFTKGILVAGEKSENATETLLALAKLFGIKITQGEEYANPAHIKMAQSCLGYYVPAPFYKGFPRSVLELSIEQLYIDQIFSYVKTYGLGDFSEPQHSVFEQTIERIALSEETEVKKFAIISEEEAKERLKGYFSDLMSSTRPLSKAHYDVALDCIVEYGFRAEDIACKDTAIELIIDTGDISYARSLRLADVIRFVDILNYKKYNNTNMKKLSLCNKDRRLVASVIDYIFAEGSLNVIDCFEKKRLWCGMLHHIHYKPKCEEAIKFVELMRGRENRSVYSAFEQAMLEKDIVRAAEILKRGKGAGALLRNLNYLISRCRTVEEVKTVVSAVEAKNAIVLIQLLMQYENYVAEGARAFRFTRHRLMKVHTETEKEQAHRKSALTPVAVDLLTTVIREKLAELLKDRLPRVYISPEMYKVALPIGEDTSSAGYGVLPKGTRVPIKLGKKLRAFTYWEKVDDIDLSCIGITGDGRAIEFSWRTMYYNQSKAITYSGDETSGYKGGSEFFDIILEDFRRDYPNVRYIVLNNNVFSCLTFRECVCRAGCMMRDIEDSGEIFEPKTVDTSFVINCDSTFAHLFAIDLQESELVWLNVSQSGNQHIAGASDVSFLLSYCNTTSVINYGSFFEMLAEEVVSTPEEADIVVSDGEHTLKEGAEQIRSFDFERVNAILNSAYST